MDMEMAMEMGMGMEMSSIRKAMESKIGFNASDSTMESEISNV